MSGVVATSAQAPTLPHGRVGRARASDSLYPFDDTLNLRMNSVASRTNLSDTYRYGEGAMSKRDRFIAELRQEAKARKLAFKVETWRGKGGHAMVFVGNKVTTLPSREIDPKTARKIRRPSALIEVAR
jgi:hypothetical protein